MYIFVDESHIKIEKSKLKELKKEPLLATKMRQSIMSLLWQAFSI